jgi:hypothetical protein
VRSRPCGRPPDALVRAPLSFALNAWLRRSLVWCLGAAWQWFLGRTQPSVWQRFSQLIWCSDRGVIRHRRRTTPAHSVLWFLALWVALVQGIGSGHSALGPVINCRGYRHLTRRINSRPAAAGRPFRCGCASTTSTPLCAGVRFPEIWRCV